MSPLNSDKIKHKSSIFLFFTSLHSSSLSEVMYRTKRHQSYEQWQRRL